ncbi:hypothetical protein FVE85_5142 [Porphyridium purpureum]|uniref:Uncharacterized protein n=1 Tax=Porphyridium purpureum TaxID=35688 RepID=A0A5J4Z4P4_PORPP|nr:hypothetical protein FVE85_5142 [Porphyridium purpureum]|eukprot:POR2869..scf295_1
MEGLKVQDSDVLNLTVVGDGRGKQDAAATANGKEEEWEALVRAPERDLRSIDTPFRLDQSGLRMYYGGAPFVGATWFGPNAFLVETLSRKKRGFQMNDQRARAGGFPQDPAELVFELQRLMHQDDQKQLPLRKILRVLRSLTYYTPHSYVPLMPEFRVLLAVDHPHVARLAHYFVRCCAPIEDDDEYRDIYEALEAEAASPSPARRAAATKSLARITKAREMRRAQDYITDVLRSVGAALTEEDKKKKKKKEKRRKKKGGEDAEQEAATKAANDTDGQDAAYEGARMIDDGAGGVIYSSRMEEAQKVKSKLGKMLVGHAVLGGMRRLQRVNVENIRVEVYFFDLGLASVCTSTVRHAMAMLEARTYGSATPVAQYLLPRLPHKNPPKNLRLKLEDLGAKVYYARILGILAQDPDFAQYVPEKNALQWRKEQQSSMIEKAAPSSAMDAAGSSNAGDGTDTGPAAKPEKRGFFRFIFNGGKKLFGGIRRKLGLEKRMRPNDPLGVEFVEALLRLIQNPSNRVLLEVVRGVSRRRWITWANVPVPQAALFGSAELEEPRQLDLSEWAKEDENENEVSSNDDEDGMAADNMDDADFFDWDPDAAAAEGGNQTQLLEDEDVVEQVEIQVDEQVVRENTKKTTFIQRMKEKRATNRQKKFDLNTPFYLRRVGEGSVTALEAIMRRVYAAMNSDETTRRLAAAESAVHLGRAKLYSDTEEERELYKLAKEKIFSQESKKTGNRHVLDGSGNASAQQQQQQQSTRAGLFGRRKSGAPASSMVAAAAQNMMVQQQEQAKLANGGKAQPKAITSGARFAGQQALVPVTVPDGGSDPNGGLALAIASVGVGGTGAGNLKPASELEDSPLEPLVMPLKDLMDEDVSLAVRSEAGTALMFFLASGAGIKAFAALAAAERERRWNDPDAFGKETLDDFYSPPGERVDSCMLVRYFGAYLRDPAHGAGIGFESAERVMDTLLYEILEESPWLGVDAVELAEYWAMKHPNAGPVGKLGLFWEALLSVGSQEAGIAVGASVTRCLLVDPSRERVACAAAVFLRRRILDIAVLSAGYVDRLGSGIPEPLPEEIGEEIERYFSALWHGVVLGPSAEARALCVQALGGGAVLAGDPFRIATYERLTELVRARGYGLRLSAETVLDSLDTMYYTRERLAEARVKMMQMGHASNYSKWLKGVWKLAAESACAAQVILGCPPPPGWEPLGPEGSQVVAESEAKHGNYRLREVRVANENIDEIYDGPSGGMNGADGWANRLAAGAAPPPPMLRLRDGPHGYAAEQQPQQQSIQGLQLNLPH